MSVIGNDPVPPIAAIPAEPAVVPAPAAPQPGPWAADLAEYFPDEASRAAADRYMREKVQPARTQLEQQLADPELAAAKSLYDDFITDDRTTLTNIVTELYGQEKAVEFAKLFGDPAAPALVVADETIPFEKLPPEVQVIVKRDQEAAAAKEYADTIKGWIDGHADLTDEDLPYVHGHVAAAKGNLESAAAMYIAQRTAMAARFAPVVPVVDPPPAVPAPATLGAAGAAPAGAPPIAPKKETMEEALHGWLADERAASAPPTVGTV